MAWHKWANDSLCCAYCGLAFRAICEGQWSACQMRGDLG